MFHVYNFCVLSCSKLALHCTRDEARHCLYNTLCIQLLGKNFHPAVSMDFFPVIPLKFVKDFNDKSYSCKMRDYENVRAGPNDGPYVTPFTHTLPCEIYLDLP